MVRFLGVLYACLMIGSLFGQVEVRLPTNGRSILSAEELLQLTIISHHPLLQTIRLRGSLENQGKVCWQGASGSLRLASGEHRVSNSNVSWQEAGISIDLEAGNYTFCLVIEDVSTGQELGRGCQLVSIESQMAQEQNNERKFGLEVPLDKDFSFGGRVNLEGTFSNQPLPQSMRPATFFRAQIQPQLTVFGIPLQGSLFATTESQGLNYQLTSGNIGLDPNELLNKLQQKARAKLEESLTSGDSSYLQRLKSLQEQEYQAQLNQVSPQERWRIDSLMKGSNSDMVQWERIDKVLENPQMKAVEQKWADAKSRYDLPDEEKDYAIFEDSLKMADSAAYENWMNLKSTHNQYQRLREKKEKLETSLGDVETWKKSKATMQRLESTKKKGPQALLRDPKHLKESGLISEGEEKWLDVKRLRVGTVFPSESPMILDGISLDGLDLALAPGKFYVASTAGLVRTNWQTFLPIPIAMQQQEPKPRSQVNAFLGHVKGGIGTPESDHVHGMVLWGHEWMKGETSSRYENRVFGIDAQYALLNNRLVIRGAYYKSISQGNPQEVPWSGTDTTNQFLANSLQLLGWPARPTNQTGESWEVEGVLSLWQNRTRLTATLQDISANYYSFGAPNLMRGERSYQLGLHQRILNSAWQVSTLMRRGINPLLPDNGSRVITNSWGVQSTFNKSGWPMVSFQYLPIYRQYLGDSLLQEGYQQSMVNSTVSFPYQWLGAQWSSTATYSGQFGVGDSSRTFYSQLVNFSQSVGLNQVLSLSLTGIYMAADYVAGRHEMKGVDLGIRMQTSKQWSNTATFSWLQEALVAERFGGSFRTSLTLNRFFSATITVAHWRYVDRPDTEQLAVQPNYLSCSAGTTLSW